MTTKNRRDAAYEKWCNNANILILTSGDLWHNVTNSWMSDADAEKLYGSSVLIKNGEETNAYHYA